MMPATAGGGDGGGPKRGPYRGFWMWAAEMERLDLWPRMDEAFQGRSLERSSYEAGGRVEGASRSTGTDERSELEAALQEARQGGSKQ